MGDHWSCQFSVLSSQETFFAAQEAVLQNCEKRMHWRGKGWGEQARRKSKDMLEALHLGFLLGAGECSSGICPGGLVMVD